MVNTKKLILFKLLVVLAFMFSTTTLKANQFQKEFLLYSVSASAKDVSSAKASIKARAQAKKAAITMLLEKMVLKQDRVKIQGLLDSSSTDQLVSRMRITNEVVSSVSYSANFVFEFDAQRVVDFLNETKLKFVYLDKQVDFVVLPLFRDLNSNKAMLWEDENKWKQAVFSKENTYQASIYDIANTAVTVQDLESINSSDVVHKNVLQKAKVVNSASEGAFILELSLKGDVYILKATNLEDKKDIFVKSYSESKLQEQNKLRGIDIYQYIAQDASVELNDYFLEQAYSIITSEAKDSYFILYFNDLNKLTRFKRQLQNIISVESFTVEKFYSNKVVLKVKHKNKLDAIDNDLKSLGFYIESVSRSIVSGDIATVEECVNSVCTN